LGNGSCCRYAGSCLVRYPCTASILAPAWSSVSNRVFVRVQTNGNRVPDIFFPEKESFFGNAHGKHVGDDGRTCCGRGDGHVRVVM
jgi:hypothetical protein